MKVKRLLALAMASVLMLSSAQTTALEAYAAEIPVVEEQSTQDVTQSEADIQNDEVIGEADLDTTVNDVSMQKDPEDEEFIQDDTASDAADEKSVTLEDAEEADDDAKASEDDAESEEITVTFDANGGVFENGETTSVVNVKKGEPLTTLPMNPEMGDGSLVFSGWYYDKEGTSIVDLSTFAPEEEVTIYAGWTKEDIELDETATEEKSSKLLATNGFYLNANGGTFPDGSDIKEITYITKYLSSDQYKPVKADKIFKGWYADQNCTQPLSNGDDPYSSTCYSLKETPEQGTTIYAGWGPYYTITYIFGKEGGTDPEKDTGFFCEYGTTDKLKEYQYKIPQTEGYKLSNCHIAENYIRNEERHYTFSAWYEDEARTQKISDMHNVVPGGDETYYVGYAKTNCVIRIHVNDTNAYFTKESDAYYDPDGGEYESYYVATAFGYEHSVSIGSCKNKVVNRDPKKVVNGFYLDKACTQPAEVTESGYYNIKRNSEDIDLYLGWSETNKVITFDANGGYFFDNEKPDDTSVSTYAIGHAETDSKVSFSTKFPVWHTDLHKRFLGWDKDKNATTPEFALSSTSTAHKLSISVPVTKDEIYYAIWEDAYKIVTFDAGNGTFNYYDARLEKDVVGMDKAVVTTNTYGRPMYNPSNVTSTEPDLLFEAWYDGNTKISSLYSFYPEKDVTLTAHYIKTYTVYFDAGDDGTFEYTNEAGNKVEGATNASFKTNQNKKLSKYPTKVTANDPERKIFEAWYQGDEKISYISSHVFENDASLVARYLNIYKVTFKSDGTKGKFNYYDDNGEYHENATEAVLKTGSDGKVVRKPYDPVNVSDDWIFEGWYDEAGNKIDSLYSYVPESDVVVTAKYVPVYNVVFNAGDNGNATFTYYDSTEGTVSGKTTVTRKTNKSGKVQNAPYNCIPGNPGNYEFDAWVDKAGNRIEKISDYVFTADTELTAHYVKLITVTFDAGDGNTLADDGVQTKSYKTSAKGILSNYPSKANYKDASMVFAGWEDKKSGIVYDTYLYGTVFTDDATLTARYTGAFKVTFKAGKGTFSYKDADGNTVTGTEVTYTTDKDGHVSKVPSNVTPSAGDQAFDAWYIGDKKISSISSYKFTKTETVTAGYTTSVKITLNANGGYFDSPEKTEKTVTVAKGKSTNLGIPRNADDSKKFGGWYEGEDLIKSVPGSYKATNDVTLYAKWLDTRTVTFKTGAGKISSTIEVKMTVVKGSIFGTQYYDGIPDDPTADDPSEAFVGWFTDSACADKDRISKAEILNYKVDEDVIFYAGYKGSYTVSFDPNGGSFVTGHSSLETVKVATGESLKGKYPTVKSTEEKVFRGWFEDKECTKPIANISAYIPTSNITLYAGYTECFILTFKTGKSGIKFQSNDSDTVTVKINKGEAFRYGEELEDKNYLFKAPRVEYAEADNMLPVVSSQPDGDNFWTTTDAPGKQFFFSDSSHYYVDENGNTNYFNMYGFVPTKSMTFTALWGKKVTVTFDPNGGQFLNNTTENKYTTLKNGKRYLEIASGMTFNAIHRPSTSSSYMVPPSGKDSCSWGYDKEGKYIGGQTITNDITYFAKWSTSSSGGTSTASKQIILHAGEGYYSNYDTKAATTSYTSTNTTSRHSVAIPTIDDKTKAFCGYYYDAKCEKPYPAEYQIYSGGTWYIIVPKDITDLYAGYAPTYTVTLDANGGYFDDSEDREKDPDAYMKEDSVMIVKASPAGYGVRISDYTKRIRKDGDEIFTGWYLKKDYSEKAVTCADSSSLEYYKPTSDCTLYAKWTDYAYDEKTITVSPKNVTLKVGGTGQLTATVTPESVAKTQDIHWFINTNSYDSKNNTKRIPPVTIDSNGLVTANGAGTASVYAEVNGVRSELVSITVSSEEVKPSLSVEPAAVTISTGEKATVSAIVVPADKAGSVNWTSNKPEVATVTEKGGVATITGVGEGTAKITAKVDSLTATVNVTVNKKALPIVLDKTTLTLTAKEGVQETLTATLGPDAEGNEVIWTSSDDTALKVTAEADSRKAVLVPATGLEQSKKVTVTAAVKDTEFSATCEVMVNPVASVEKPVASVAPGAVKKDTVVTLSTETYGASIFYTEDGSEPIVSDAGKYAEPTKLYIDGFRITADKTIKAIAWKDGMKSSAVITFAYSISKEDWGELDDAAQALFKDASEVPSGVWFTVGDGKYYEKGAVTGKEESYTGSKITFNSEVKVYHGTSRLIENRDYTLTFANNTVAASAGIGAKAPKVTVKGKGNYSSSEVFFFTITPASMSDAVITSERVVAAAVGSKLANVKPVVAFAGKKLAVNKDYALEYYKGMERIADADLKTYKVESGAEYTIKVTGLGGNFEKKTMDEAVLVKAFDSKNKSMVQVSKLKVLDSNNKAFNLSYPGEGIDIAKLFDNSEGNTATYFVKDGKDTLVYDKDYYIITESAEAYKPGGKHSFAIVGKERVLTEEEITAGEKSYYGSKTIAYSTTAMKQVKITGLLTSVEYTGKEISLKDISNPKIVLTNSKTKAVLTESNDGMTGDYTMTMDNAGSVGKFNVVFTGINGYEGTVTKTVTVKAYNVKNDAKKKLNIDVAEGSVYTKAGARPEVTVYFDGMLLKEGSDYTLTYKNNLKVAGKNDKGAPTVTVKGKGNFTGANATKTFSIAKGDVERITLTVDDVAYNAKGRNGYFKVVPKLTEAGKAVTAGKNKDVDAIAKTDYVYTYAADTVLKNGTARYKDQKVEDTDKVLPGTEIKVTAKVTCQGSKTYGPENGGEIVGFYKVIESGMNIKSAKASIKKDALNSGRISYNDSEEVVLLKSEDLDVTMKVKGKNVTLKPEDYEVVSVTGNRFLGTATVTIKGLGEYGGTKSLTFKISAKKF